MGIQVPPDSTGKVVETNSPDGATQRQVVTLGDKTTAANVGAVLASGALKIEPGGANTQPVTGTVTANIGTSGSLALDASVTGLQVAQASTTSGQKGSLVQGAVTTNSPTYINGQTDPISIDTAGNVRVSLQGTPSNINSLMVQAVGNGAVLSNQQAVTGTAVALASNACRKVAIKALLANTINVYVGPSGVTTSTGFELGPGESVTLDVTNTNLVFVIASTTGASVSWIATN